MRGSRRKEGRPRDRGLKKRNSWRCSMPRRRARLSRSLSRCSRVLCKWCRRLGIRGTKASRWWSLKRNKILWKVRSLEISRGSKCARRLKPKLVKRTGPSGKSSYLIQSAPQSHKQLQGSRMKRQFQMKSKTQRPQDGKCLTPKLCSR